MNLQRLTLQDINDNSNTHFLTNNFFLQYCYFLRLLIIMCKVKLDACYDVSVFFSNSTLLYNKPIALHHYCTIHCHSDRSYCCDA